MKIEEFLSDDQSELSLEQLQLLSLKKQEREERRQWLHKQIVGMLKCQIDRHGSITSYWVGSTAKRIANQLEAVIYTKD